MPRRNPRLRKMKFTVPWPARIGPFTRSAYETDPYSSYASYTDERDTSYPLLDGDGVVIQRAQEHGHDGEYEVAWPDGAEYFNSRDEALRSFQEDVQEMVREREEAGRRNPRRARRNTGYVAAKIRANTARRNGEDPSESAGRYFWACDMADREFKRKFGYTPDADSGGFDTMDHANAHQAMIKKYMSTARKNRGW